MMAPNQGGKRRRRPLSGARVRPLDAALAEVGRAIAAGADAVGRSELRFAALVGRPAHAAARRAGMMTRVAERFVTPSRAVAAVIVCAAIMLAISQFVDYRGVRIGGELYQGVEAVAPAPQTDREPAGSAHGYLLLPVAALAIVACGLALRGRWQLGRVVSLLGVIAIAVSLFVDRPTGLEEGLAARNFEGADAVLLEGFWAQLAASGVLVVTGALLSRYLRLEQPGSRRRRAVGRRRGSAMEARA